MAATNGSLKTTKWAATTRHLTRYTRLRARWLVMLLIIIPKIVATKSDLIT